MTQSLWCHRVLLEDGWHEDVALSLDPNGVIREIEPRRRLPTDECLDGVVVPGMPNLHSHGFQRAIAGLGGSRQSRHDSFWSWRERMYRTAKRITPQQLSDCMGGVYLSMLKAGYTSCAEFHYLHHDVDGRPYDDPAELGRRVVAAASQAGIGLTLLPVLYCRSGFDSAEVTPEQRRFAHTPERFIQLVQAYEKLVEQNPLLHIGFAPHSLRAVSETDLGETLPYLMQPGRPVHMHIAEQPLEVEDCQRHLGARPVQWLADHVSLDSRWCLVHATHTTATELDTMAVAGVTVGLCPTTEADLGDGFFAAEAWRDHGGSFGIGSDSNLRIDPAEELRLLESGQRLRTGLRNVLASEHLSCGRYLYQAACEGGGRALGRKVGVIQKGFRADLVTLDDQHPLLAGLQGDTLLDSYVFAGGADLIHSVYVAGKCLVNQGRHRDDEQIEQRFSSCMQALRQ